MLYHRCDEKVYTQDQAATHEHANNPDLCIKGWRKATMREILKRPGARCQQCGTAIHHGRFCGGMMCAKTRRRSDGKQVPRGA